MIFGSHFVLFSPDADADRARPIAELVTELEAGTRETLDGRAFAVLDVYPQAPTGALIGTQLPVVNLEAGLTFNWSPLPRVWRFDWPRLGISYREAGIVSGWRIVLGAPF